MNEKVKDQAQLLAALLFVIKQFVFYLENPWAQTLKKKNVFLWERKLSSKMKANCAIEHDITDSCSQVNIEKDILVEIFNYESTSDCKHIVSSHRFLQEQCTDGILY